MFTRVLPTGGAGRAGGPAGAGAGRGRGAPGPGARGPPPPPRDNVAPAPRNHHRKPGSSLAVYLYCVEPPSAFRYSLWRSARGSEGDTS